MKLGKYQKWAYCIALCVLISLGCFFVFDHFFIGDMGKLWVSFVGPAVQIIGCAMVGWFVAKKEVKKQTAHPCPVPMLDTFPMLLFAGVLIVFLVCPQIQWDASDAFLYICAPDPYATLSSSSPVRQFIILRLIDYPAILAFFACAFSGYLVKRKSNG